MRSVPFRLGPWLVRPRRHLLTSEEEERRLGPKPMAVLLLLVERAGEVVSKDEVAAAVWGADSPSDEAIAAVVYELRRALGDEAREPRYVETIRKSGYRLLVDPLPASPPVEGGTLRSRRGWLALALLVVGAGALGWVEQWRRSSAPEPVPTRPEIRSLAVLPVASFSSLPDEELLAGALTQMLIADLDQVCRVDVAPGLAVRGREEPWALDSALDLGVDAILEGSVLRSAGRIWISVQLVEMTTGRLLWSRTYDRELEDELLVLREVALDVAERVRERIEPG